MEFLNLQIILNKPIEFINEFERYHGIFQKKIDERILDLFLEEFIAQINSKENFKKLNLKQFSFFVSKLPKDFQHVLYCKISGLKIHNK